MPAGALGAHPFVLADWAERHHPAVPTISRFFGITVAMYSIVQDQDIVSASRVLDQ